MGGLIRGIFGGTNDSSQTAQIEANRSSEQFIRQQAERARNDVLNIFPAGDEARNQSLNQALAIFGQSAPAQADAFAEGNTAAQAALLGGLSQFQNAILGRSVDFSALQPTRITPDFSSIQNVALPDFSSGASEVQRAQTPQVDLQSISQLLSRSRNFGLGGVNF